MRFPSPKSCVCRIAVCLSAAAALFLGACSKQENPPPDVLAKVGERTIRIGDLQAEAERLRKHGRAVLDKQTLLNQLVQHEALLQRAKAAGLDKDPQVARELSNLLIAKLIDRETAAKTNAIEVTEDEVRAEYEKNLAKYTLPGQVRLAVLSQPVNPGASDAARAQTRALLTEAKEKFAQAPAPSGRGPNAQGFGALAAQYSEDQASRYRGGDLGWLTEGEFNYRWPREVLAAGYGLEKGKVSEIIETERGFFVVMKTDARESATRAFAEVAPAIRHALLAAKRRAADEDFRKEAERLAGVTLYEKALADVELPRSERALARNRDAAPPALPAFATERVKETR
jgi:peptidyl-prolyl cis-trans isomerase C